MSWCEQLTHKPALTKWSGPKQVHNLLSKSDEPEAGKPAPKPAPTLASNERQCKACGRIFPKTEEHFYSHAMRGKRYLHHKCRDCMKAEQIVRSRLYRQKSKRSGS